MAEAKIVAINRDPFARMDYIRRLVSNMTGGCDWCGNLSAKGNLWEYGTWGDGMYDEPGFAKGKFCCVECFRSYHNH